MPKSIHRTEYDQVRALLRTARTASGLRQADLAAQLGKLQSFVSDVERGTRRIDIIELRDWCQALGTDLVEFCEALERGLPPSATRTRPASAKRNTRTARRTRR